MRYRSGISINIPLWCPIPTPKDRILNAEIYISSETHTAPIFLLPLNHHLVSGRSGWSSVSHSDSPIFFNPLYRFPSRELYLWLKYTTILSFFPLHLRIYPSRSYLAAFRGHSWLFWLLSHRLCCA